MFFFKYLLLLQYKISFFLARINTVKNNWDFNTKLGISVAFGLYFMTFFFVSWRILEKIFNFKMAVGFGLFGGYLIVIYFLLCGIIFYKLNLAWIRAIELTKKQKNKSRIILFLTIVIVILLFKL
jgi:hypothetical protein